MRRRTFLMSSMSAALGATLVDQAAAIHEHSSVGECLLPDECCIPDEPIIEPSLSIIDTHHHLWLTKVSDGQIFKADNVQARGLVLVLRKRGRYLLDEFLADARSGHSIIATVYLEAGAMYRPDGPEEMKSLGEVEFANGIAAMAASGRFGAVKVCAGIVGHANLRLGDKVEDVLSAHLRAAGGRYRGVRHTTMYDPDSRLLAGGVREVLLDKHFRAGFKCLQKLGLSFDALVLEPQLPEVIDLARTFPETQIILNHAGRPVGASSYKGKREQRFSLWRDNIRELSRCNNVAVKLGGLGTGMSGFESFMATPSFTSEQLAAEWQPYVHTCIDAFGAHRCMFESNFPVDSATCTYSVLWNTFKRLTAGASNDEKTALFSGTAARVYRLQV